MYHVANGLDVTGRPTRKNLKPMTGMAWTAKYVIVSVILCLSFAAPAVASTLIVSSGTDNGAGSLRQAVRDAMAGDTINLTADVTLTSGGLTLAKDVTIVGIGGKRTIRRSTAAGTPEFRILLIDQAIVSLSNLIVSKGLATQGGGAFVNGGRLTVTDCTFSNNRATDANFGGGAIFNTSGTAGELRIDTCIFKENLAITGGAICNFLFANLYVKNTAFTENQALAYGAAIENCNVATVENCTISNNISNSVGAVYNRDFGSLGLPASPPVVQTTLRNSTLSGNVANYGAAVFNDQNAQLILDSCTFFNNSALSRSTTGPDGGDSIYNYGSVATTNSIFRASIGGINFFNRPARTILSNGHNLANDNGQSMLTATTDIINADVLLGPLSPNGGPTQTHAPLPGSPAINAGNTSLAVDQRGINRPQGNADDIGAYEVVASYSIEGRVTGEAGAGLAGVTINRSGGGNAITDNNGNYIFSGLPSATYTLTPVRSGYAFNPATRTVTLTTSSATGQNFVGANTTLSGRVAFSNGIGIANVQVRLNNGQSLFTNSAGYYTFPGVLNGAYTVTPVLSGYSFEPAFRSVVISNSNVSNVNFVGGYSISGRVSWAPTEPNSGVGIPNIRIYRTGSTVAALTNGAGYYTFYGVGDGTYTITPDTNQGYSYNIASRSFTASGGSIANQNFLAREGFRIAGASCRATARQFPM